MSLFSYISLGAVISIITKKFMYWYTIKYAKLINSTLLKADAYHQRSDSLSSIDSLIGILFSRYHRLYIQIVYCIYIRLLMVFLHKIPRTFLIYKKK